MVMWWRWWQRWRRGDGNGGGGDGGGGGNSRLAIMTVVMTVCMLASLHAYLYVFSCNSFVSCSFSFSSFSLFSSFSFFFLSSFHFSIVYHTIYIPLFTFAYFPFFRFVYGVQNLSTPFCNWVYFFLFFVFPARKFIAENFPIPPIVCANRVAWSRSFVLCFMYVQYMGKYLTYNNPTFYLILLL